jgi:hypothetical protein
MKRKRNHTGDLEMIPIRTADIRSIPSNRCLFCGGNLQGQAAEEHIFPRWLLRELDIEGEVITPTHLSAFDMGTELSRREHVLGRLVEGRVCRDCNCGWMADLENAARPLLLELIRGRRDVWTLLTAEGLLLARWVLKTTAVLNSASNYSNLVPQDHYRAILRGEIPAGAAAYAQQAAAGESPFYWLQSGMWQVVHAGGSRKKLRQLAARSYKVALRFDRLLLMAAYWPEAGWSQVRWKGVHYLLSSSAGHAYPRDPKEFPAGHASEAFGAFMASLQIAQDGTYEVRE